MASKRKAKLGSAGNPFKISVRRKKMPKGNTPVKVGSNYMVIKNK